MNSSANKKDFFYVVVLILTFITVVVGMTFAIYYWIFSQEEGSSAVYTGTLSIDYLSGNLIDFHLLYPSLEPDVNATENVYRNEFKITNTGTLDGIMQVSLDILINEFSNDTLKYILFDLDGNPLSTGYVNGTGDIVISNNVLIPGNTSQNYILIIWLNENFQEQNEEMKKYLTGSIAADAVQKKD